MRFDPPGILAGVPGHFFDGEDALAVEEGQQVL